MNLLETIHEKIFRLPPKAQEEVLKQVEEIEERYHSSDEPKDSNGMEHPLTMIARLRVEGLPSDFASRHDFYCHGKLED